MKSSVIHQPEQAQEPSPLHWAVDRGDLEDIARLAADGAPVNAPARDGVTALHWAAYYQTALVVRRLLQLGADPNARTLQGQTPLHWAVLRDPLLLAQGEDRPPIISLLLAHGADPGAETEAGETALDLAVATAPVSAEVVSLLRAAPGPPDLGGAE